MTNPQTTKLSNRINCRSLSIAVQKIPPHPDDHTTWKCCITPLCEICNLERKIYETRQWFSRVGRKYQQNFVSKLILLCNSSDILQYLIDLLSVIEAKDAVYSLVRRTPAKVEPNPNLVAPNISKNWLSKRMEESLTWFGKANVWTRTNFLLLVLCLADLQLLRTVRNEMRSLLSLRTHMSRAGFLPTNCKCQQDAVDTIQSLISKEDQQQINKLIADASTKPRKEKKKKKLPRKLDDFRELPSGTVLYAELMDEIMKGKEKSATDMNKCAYIIKDKKLDSMIPDVKVDFSVELPIPLLQKILGYLDEESLNSCAKVKGPLKMAAQHILQERGNDVTSRSVADKLITSVTSKKPLKNVMKRAAVPNAISTSPIELNPTFAIDVFVIIPVVDPDTLKPIHAQPDDSIDEFLIFARAFSGMKTRRVLMEMRNVYCSQYTQIMLIRRHDLTRIVHHDGNGPLVAIGGLASSIRFFSLRTLRPLRMIIKKRSVRCIELVQNEHIVFTGGYDTTVRCWSLRTGRCKKVFLGHRDTVLCLSVYGNRLAAGSKDGKTKLWDFVGQKFLFTFTDSHAVTSVSLSDAVCVTGCKRGNLRVYSVFNGNLIKQLTSHTQMVTCVRVHRWFILSASRDFSARVWSAQGKVHKCLTYLPHPDEVTQVEFCYLRVITSCWDGRLRVWDVESGRLLKLLYSTDQQCLSPILSFHPGNNWIVVNTIAHVVVMKFAPVDWNYDRTTEHLTTHVDKTRSVEWTMLRSQPLSLGRSGPCHFSTLKGIRGVRDIQWSAAVRASLTPHTVRLMKSFLRTSQRERSIRPWTTSSLTDVRANLLSLTLDNAKALLWSQMRTPFDVPAPEPINSFLTQLKHPLAVKVVRARSVNQLDDPAVMNDVGQRAAKLHVTIEGRRLQSTRAESLWRRTEQTNKMAPQIDAGNSLWKADNKLPTGQRSSRVKRNEVKTTIVDEKKQTLMRSKAPCHEYPKQKFISNFTTTGGECDEVKVQLWSKTPQRANVAVSLPPRRNPFNTNVNLHLT